MIIEPILYGAMIGGASTLMLTSIIDSLKKSKNFRVNNSGRLEVVDTEDNVIMILAGEAGPELYKKYVDRARLKHRLLTRIIIGPHIHCFDQDYYNVFNDQGEIVNFDNILQIHPLLQFLNTNSNNIQLYIKNKSIPNERHFMAGEKTGITYCEKPHKEEELPPGGYMYRRTRTINRKKIREFYHHIQNQSYCRRIRYSHYRQDLHEVIADSRVTFIPLSKVKKQDSSR